MQRSRPRLWIFDLFQKLPPLSRRRAVATHDLANPRPGTAGRPAVARRFNGGKGSEKSPSLAPQAVAQRSGTTEDQRNAQFGPNDI